MTARPADTTHEADALMAAHWAQASFAERLATFDSLCADVERLARADIVSKHPEFDEIHILHELARRRYGTELADAAYAGLLRGR